MKKTNFNVGFIIFIIAIIFCSILPNSAHIEAASSDLMKITKTADVNKLVENDVANVTLSIQGTPKDSTYVRPNDVILIVDKSGSMQTDNRLDAAKNATKEFIDLMDLTKHQVGIVDYGSSVSSLPLTTDATIAKNYVDTIQLGGGTETGLAVRQATAMLANHRPEAQPTIVILTDGAANNTADALASAKAAQEAGIIFYSIALLGPNENPDTSAPNQLLKDMSTSAEHHHFVLGSVGLSEVYKSIVEEIGSASAYNVKITDSISPELEIVPGSYDNNIPKPKVNGNILEWDIQELKSKELTFTYQVRAKTSTKVGKYLLGTTSARFEDHEKSKYTVYSTNPYINVLNPKPVITSINPGKGLTIGGEEVTITGEKFLPGAKVYFGLNEATILSESSNNIVVTTPTGSQGPIEVKVINPDKQFAIGSFNYYAEPTLSHVTPSEGEMVGGNQISVIGTNFMNDAKVFINGKEAITKFSVKERLYAIVPSSTKPGLVAVKVVNPDGTEVEKTDAYTYLAPPSIQLDSLSATSGKLEGGERIFLNGAMFDPDAKVYFGDKEVNIDYFSSSSKIRVIVPQGDAAELVTVKVVNPDGSFAELVDGYEYLAPPPAPAVKLISLSAKSGQLIGGESIYLSGANFDKDVKVYFGDKEAVVSTYVSSSKIQVVVPQGDVAGLVTVKVVNSDSSTAELTDGYEYLPKPTVQLKNLAVTSGKLMGGERIFIYGENFDPKAKVYFGNKEVNVDYFSSSSKIRVIVPQGDAAGLVTVKVVNPDGSFAELANAYEYLLAQ